MYYVGTEGDGGVAEAMCDSNHRPAIDRGVLDRGLRHSRRIWVRSVSGKCPGDEELTRAQKRCAGEAMADEAAHLWSVAELVSASQEIRTMRTYWRQRNDLVRAAGRHIQRMQKALTQMNIQLANVLSDVSGMTGQAIVKAILAGERDPYELAALRNWRVKASEEEIARSLEGNWQEDLLFVLQQEQDGYEFCQRQMAECDQRLQQYLQQLEDRSHGAGLPEEKRKERLRKKKKGNAPQFDLRAELFRMTGTDLTQIDGIDVTTTMTILSEAGWDMSKWKTEHHFVSWLRLCPDNRISGDKIIGKGRLPTNNRVTNALRMAASTLRLSNTYLGAQFRRLRTKLGAPVAIKAMAAKLARLVYRMLRYGMTFIDRGAEFYDAQHRKLQINYLKHKAANFGFQIIEVPAA